jgi:hypothetical protein
MNREDIIRMAREAGLIDPDLGECVTDYGDATDSIRRFAALVTAAEREACAEICDRVARRYGDGPELTHFQQGFGDGAEVSAAKIRARVKK